MGLIRVANRRHGLTVFLLNARIFYLNCVFTLFSHPLFLVSIMTIPFSRVDMSLFLISDYTQNVFIVTNAKTWGDRVKKQNSQGNPR